MIGQRLREDDGFASDREVTDRINMLGRAFQSAAERRDCARPMGLTL